MKGIEVAIWWLLVSIMWLSLTIQCSISKLADKL